MSDLTRIYIVEDALDRKLLLVRAADRHKALRHAVNSRFTVKLASQDDLEELLTDGMRVQRATDDAEPEEPDVTSTLFPEEEDEIARALP